MRGLKVAWKPIRPRPRRLLSAIVAPILLFVSVDLALTFVTFAISDASVRVGVLRPQNSILPKIGELAGVGIGLGVLSNLTRKSFDSVLGLLSASFVLLLDLDHLPSTVGLPQPIRPAHSLGFLLMAGLGFVVFFRKTPELEFVLVSSFLGHMSADTGVFGIFEPFFFQYVPLESYRLLLAGLAVLFALLAGKVRYDRLRNTMG